jgi:hypothetical protein
MKKVFLTLALVLTTVVASAQWYVGGGLGFSKQGDATNINLKPEAGYKINDAWTVGAEVELDWVKDGDTALTLTPYVRYTVLTAGEFSAYAEGYVDFKTMDAEGMGLGIRPVIAYNLTENWTIAAKLGKGLYYQDKKLAGGADPKMGLDLDNGCAFSLYYNF